MTGEGQTSLGGSWSGLSVTTGDLFGFLSDFRGANQPVAEPSDGVEDGTAEHRDRWPARPAAPRWSEPSKTLAGSWAPLKAPAPNWPAQQPGAATAPVVTYNRAVGSNSMASTALGLGLGSLLVPLLAVPGLILGIKSLRITQRQPWVGGRGKAIAGIVTSLFLGPVVCVIALLAFLNATHHEDMGKVQAVVSSMMKTRVQQGTGAAPALLVQCPSSEPRRAGVVFYCQVIDAGNGRSVTWQVRETDSSGDVIVAAVPSESP